jgi:CheY-like chemotaxis protein
LFHTLSQFNILMENCSMHILVADDDVDDLDFFRFALEKLSTNVKLTTVEDGEDLIKWLHQNQRTLPNLLFLDLNMPRKNGYDCLVEIKQNPFFQSLPIIILSTTVNPVEMDNLYKNGALYYVKKPNSLKELTNLLDKILQLPEEKKQFQPPKDSFVFQ